MKVLVDTDAFCKLGLAGLLTDAVAVLGGQLADCERLPALPHMLQRGSVPKHYGTENCGSLLETANAIAPLKESTSEWLDRLLPVPGIDPGEAQIFAAAAERKVLLLSGDKRALQALSKVEGAGEALAGLIVTVEAALIALHSFISADDLRARVAGIRPFDRTVAICFSDGNSDPLAALWSYYDNIASEVAPLSLWRPPASRT